MKKKILITTLIIIIICGCIGYIFVNNKNNSKEINNNVKESAFIVKNQNGEKVKINGDKMVELSGFAGATMNVYYLRDNSLYYMDINNKKEILLANNVTDITKSNDTVTATLSYNSIIYKDNQYISYKNCTREKYEDSQGKITYIYGEKILGLSGFAGSSFQKYYIRNKTLYYRNINISDEIEEIYAYNVSDIYVKDGKLYVKLDEDGIIINTNSYIDYIQDNQNVINSDDNNSSNNAINNEYILTNQIGEQVEIKADKYLNLEGFSGASNHVYYLKNNDLYYKNLSTKEDTLLASNVTDIVNTDGKVIVTLSYNSIIYNDNNYIEYNGFKKNTIIDQVGNEVYIYGNSLLSLKGFSGASNHIYYLRNNTLYYRNISGENNVEEICIYGVEKIQMNGEKIDVYLENKSNIIKDSQYFNLK